MKTIRWNDMEVGQKVHYHTEDAFDSTDALCEVTVKDSTHCMLRVLGLFFGDRFVPDKGEPWSLWIDDDTSSVCDLWEEGAAC